MKQLSKVKKCSYSIILIILTYGIIELFSFGGLHFLSKFRHLDYEPVDRISTKQRKIIKDLLEQKNKYVAYSSTLGWSIQKNGTSELYRANGSAIRSDREYALTPPGGVRRVATFGDSFIHGDDVKNNETWQAVMESYDSSMEVLNFGVGAYGLDQAYMRYLEEGRQYQSHFVLIGFMTENIYRNVNTYRPFYDSKTQIPLAKPRFVDKDGDLYLVPNPLKRLDDYKRLLDYPSKVLAQIGANDYYYKRRYASNALDWSPTVRLVTLFMQRFNKQRPDERIITKGRYNEKSEALKVTEKIFDNFYDAAIKNQSIPIIIMFPNNEDLIRYRKNRTKPYAILLSYFDSVGYRYIDIMSALETGDVRELIPGHYSARANRLVAKYILNYINDMSHHKN